MINDCLSCDWDIDINNYKYRNPSKKHPGMSIGSQFSNEDPFSSRDYVKKYLPNLEDHIYQFPRSRIHDDLDKPLKPFGLQTVLKNDTFLEQFLRDNGLQITLPTKERAASMEKEAVCRKIFDYANSINARPSLMLSQYEYAMYVKRHGDDVRDAYDTELEDQLYEGKCDNAWLAPNKNLLIFSMKSVSENDQDRNTIIKEMKDAWKQTHDSRLFFTSLISDQPFNYEPHQIMVFPNLTSDTIEKYLCPTHQEVCMTRETLGNRSVMEKFFQQFTIVRPQQHQAAFDQDYNTIATRCILFSCRININKRPLMETKELTQEITEKINRVGKEPLYLAPTQKELIDGFSIHINNENYRKVIINGHYGTGKTFTLFLGMEKLVSMLSKQKNAKHPLILFLSAKERHRQNIGGHMKDAYDLFLKDLIDRNRNVSFLILEDKLALQVAYDSGIVAQSGKEIFALTEKSWSSNTFKEFLKGIFKPPTEYKEGVQEAFQRSTKLKSEEITYEKQLVYNYPKKYDGTYSSEITEFDIHIFADEVDHVNVNFDNITSSPEYKNAVVWLALNSERCYDNKKLIQKIGSQFQAINLEFVLRNARLVTEFVNEMRKGLVGCKETISDTASGHCVEGFRPTILFPELLDINEKATNYIPLLDNYCKISAYRQTNQTHQIYQKLQNVIKIAICRMFALDENITFIGAFEAMDPVCIVSLEIINSFLVDCFKIVDEGETFRQKVIFQTSHEVIGREFPNVIYAGVSYIYLENSKTKDILYSDLMNVASRPKNQLCLIDLGCDESEIYS